MTFHYLARCFAAVALFLAGVVFCSSAARAQEDEEGVKVSLGHSRGQSEIAGHWFIPSGFVSDPFVTTHIRTGTGGGVATASRLPLTT